MIILRKEFSKKSKKPSRLDQIQDEDFKNDTKVAARKLKKGRMWNKAGLMSSMGILGAAHGAAIGAGSSDSKLGAGIGALAGTGIGVAGGYGLARLANRPFKRYEKELKELEDKYNNTTDRKEKAYYRQRYKDLLDGKAQERRR